MTWLSFACGALCTVWALLSVVCIAALVFDREHTPETTLTSDPATWQRLSPSGTNMETQRDREAA